MRHLYIQNKIRKRHQNPQGKETYCNRTFTDKVDYSNHITGWTAHTVTMILPWAQNIEFPQDFTQDFTLDSLMDPLLDFHQHILLVSPEAQCIE